MMKISSMQIYWGLALSVGAAIGVAASSGIGTIRSQGAFRLDEATVSDNGTLFEGSVVEANGAPASVALSSGAKFTLGTGARGKVFGDRLILEKGTTSVENSTAFKLVAQGLTIQSDRGSASGSIVVAKAGRVQVQSGTAALRILASNGQLVANMAPGVALAFEPQTTQAGVTRITGCLEQKSGHYVVTDEVTNVTVEVAGGTAAKERGNRVEVTGTLELAGAAPSDASQVIRARDIRRLSQGCEAGAAAAATGRTGGNSKLGIGAAKTTIAVIGGVAVAGVVGGLAAADALPGQTSSASSR